MVTLALPISLKARAARDAIISFESATHGSLTDARLAINEEVVTLVARTVEEKNPPVLSEWKLLTVRHGRQLDPGKQTIPSDSFSFETPVRARENFVVARTIIPRNA